MTKFKNRLLPVFFSLLLITSTFAGIVVPGSASATKGNSLSNISSNGAVTDSAFAAQTPSAGAFTEGGGLEVYVNQSVTLNVDNSTTIEEARIILENPHKGDDISVNASVNSNVDVKSSASNITDRNGNTRMVLELEANGTTAAVSDFEEVFRTTTFNNTESATSLQERRVRFSLGPRLPMDETGHYYNYSSTARTWTNARDQAHTYPNGSGNLTRNGYLATIRSEAENSWVDSTAGNNDVWLAGSDTDEEDQWEWKAGSPEDEVRFWDGASDTLIVGYVNWDSGEPNDQGGQDYLKMYADGSWDDDGLPDNDDTFSYVIEYGDYAIGSDLNTVSTVKIVDQNAGGASFPLDQDFNSNSVPSNWSIGGDASWGVSHNGSTADETLRLTTASSYQAGYGLYDAGFSSSDVIRFEFDYYSAGGTGADGLSFFLVNGSITNSSNMAISSVGGSGLGFAQVENGSDLDGVTSNGANTEAFVSDPEEQGVPNAYVGIGFDEFGGFSSQTEGKDGGPGNSPDHVVIRGEGDLGKNGSGYAFEKNVDVTTLDSNGIDGNSDGTDGWRKVRITLDPTVSNGVDITVEMSWDDGSTWYTVLDKYSYGNEPPGTLKLGFAGATGGSTNYHAIDNLSVKKNSDLNITVTNASTGGQTGDSIEFTYEITNSGPNLNDEITVTDDVTTGSNGLENYSWSYTTDESDSGSGSGTSVSLDLSNGETATVTVSADIGSSVTGDLSHTLTANEGSNFSDPTGGDQTADHTVPLAPTADSGSDVSATEGDVVTLDGSASQDGGTSIAYYEWDVDNDGTYELNTTSTTIDYAFYDPGTFTVRLRVTTDGGGTDTNSTTVTVSASDNWLSSGGGPSRRGNNTDTASPVDLDVKWTFEGTNGRIFDGAAVVNGTVIFAHKGTIYARHTDDGSKNWTWSPSGKARFRMTPAVAGDRVYVVDEKNDKLYALAASDGTKQWEYSAGGKLSAAPAVQNGLIYFTDESNVIALNTDGTTNWSVSAPSGVSSDHPPAVDAQRVYIAGKKVVALNASDGSTDWTYDLQGPARTASVIEDNVVYVSASSPKLVAVHAGNGSEVWTVTSAPSTHGEMAVANGLIYRTAGGQTEARHASNGTLAWDTKIGGHASDGSIAVGNGAIYVPAKVNNGPATQLDFVILDPANGSILGGLESPRRGGRNTFKSHVALSNGTVYVGSTDFYALSGNIRPTADAGTDQTVYESARVDFDASNSTDDGSIASYSWDFGDGSTGTGETTNHTYNDTGTYEVVLTVTDDEGATDSDSITVTVKGKTVLVAKARNGSRSVAEDTSVAFNSDSYGDNTIEKTEWDFDGDGTIDATGANPSHTFSTPGTYKAVLTVTDSDGNTATDTINITVTDTTAPTASTVTNSKTVDEDTPVSFDGSGSTDNVDVTGYDWDFDGDGETDANGPTPTYTYTQPGDYTVTLNVTDDAGNTDSTTVSVTVQDTTPPDADTGTTNLTVPSDVEITFNGSGSTDNVNVTGYDWDFNGDGTVNKSGEEVTASYSADGTYTVELNASDDAGNWDTDTVTVNVTGNTALVADGGENRTIVREQPLDTADVDVTFNASESKATEGILLYEWDFDGDGTIDATGEEVTHTFSPGTDASNYPNSSVVTLDLTDTQGVTVSDSINITFKADDTTPPVGVLWANRSTINTSETTTFNGSNSTDNVGVTNYYWDFDGDGTIDETGESVTNAFGSPGDYTVTLTVGDAAGNNATATETYTVDDVTDPTPSISANSTSVDIGEAIKFNGSNSTDDDGIQSYEWKFGDNKTAGGSTAVHSYASNGTFDAKLIVTDNSSNTNSTTVQISVSDQTAPTFDSATKINDSAIKVVIGDNYAVNKSSITTGDFSLNGSATVANLSSVDNGTNADVTLRFDPVDQGAIQIDIADSINDSFGNSLVSGSKTVSQMDGVAPTYQSASKINDSAIKVVITDGVDIDESTIGSGDFSLNGSASLTNLSTVENGTNADVTLRFDPVDQETVQVDITDSINDTTGNALDSGSRNVSGLDTQRPSFDSATKINGSAIKVVIADGSDVAESSISDGDFELNGSASLANISTAENGTNADVTLRFDPVEQGTIQVNVTSAINDSSGNSLTAASRNVSGMDGLAPTYQSASKLNSSAIKVVIADGIDIDESTISTGDFELNDSATLANLSTSENGTNADVTLRFDPVDQASIQVDITNSIDDTTGNSLSSGFRTVSGFDAVAPTFASASKLNVSAIKVVISDGADVDETTIDSDDFELNGTATLSNFSTDENGSNADVTLRFDPVEQGTIRVNVTSAINDTSANSLSDASRNVSAMDGVAPTYGSASKLNSSAIKVVIADGIDVDETTVESSDFDLNGSATLANLSTSENGTNADVTLRFDPVDQETIAVSITDAINDSTGNPLNTGSKTVSGMDGVAPNVTVSQPDGGESLKGGSTYTIKWSTSENGSGIQSNSIGLAYSTDSGSSWSDIATSQTDDGSYDWSVPSIDSSSVRVRINVTDSAGNVGVDESDSDFTVDSSAPAPSSFNVTNPSGQDVSVTFDSNEQLSTVNVSISGAESATLTISDFTEIDNGDGTYTYEATYTGSSDGDYTATLDTAEDAAGNDGASSESDSVTVDTTGPSAPANPSATAIAGGDINVSFDDVDEGTVRYTVYRNDTSTSAGFANVTAVSDDNASGYTYTDTNTTNGTIYDYKIAPTDDAGNEGSNTTTVSATADGIAPTYDGASKLNSSAIKVVIGDSVDVDESTIAAGDFTLNESAAVANISSTDNGTNADVTLRFDPVEQKNVRVNITSPINDTAGNTLNSGSKTVSGMDGVAPTISNYTVTNPNGQDVKVSFDSDENLTTISLDLDLDGSDEATLTETNFTNSSGTYTATYGGSSDGEYTATLDTAEDAAGNDGASSESDSMTVDTTGPSAPQNVTATALAGGDINVSFDDVNEGTDRYTIYRNNTSTSAGFANVSTVSDDNSSQYSYTDTDTNDGTTYEYKIAATDATGNEGSNSTTVLATADATAPSISNFTVTNPSGQTVEVNFESDENLTKISVDLDLDGSDETTLTEANFTNSSGTYTATYGGSSDGEYSATLDATEDAAGNDGASSESDSVTVDTIGPSAPANPSATAIAGGDIDVSFDDVDEGAVQYTIYRNDTSTSAGFVNVTTVSDDNSSRYTHTDSGVTDGTNYEYKIAATDDAGSEGPNSTTVTASADGTAPTINSLTATNPSGQDVQVEIETNEQLGGSDGDISVSISGAETATLTGNDFTESGSGPYTYTATYSGSSDGDYTATLDTAQDSAGNDGASGESDSTTVDTSPTRPEDDFSVSISSTNAPVHAGETLGVEITVENSGEGIGTQSVTLSDFEGDQIDETTVNIRPGESTTITLNWTTGDHDIGTGSITVASEDDDASTRVTVDSAAYIDDSLRLTIADQRIPNGSTTQATVEADFTNGSTRQVGASASVTSNATSVATVTANGTVLGEGAGTAEITASYEGDVVAALLTVFENDTTGPSITRVTPPSNGQYTPGETLRINVTYDEAVEISGTPSIALDLNGTIREAELSAGSGSRNLTFAYTVQPEDPNDLDGIEFANTTIDLNGGSMADAAGNDAETDFSAHAPDLSTVTVATTGTIPSISGFESSNPTGQTVAISFNSSVQLSTIRVNVTGAESATLDTDAFEEVANDDGTYTYLATYAGSSDGEYDLTLSTATNALGEDGASGESDTATVDTTPPVASAGADRTVAEDTAMEFDGSNSSDNLGIANYTWDFDDGTVASGATSGHNFSEPGTYDVTLVVEDNAGFVNSTSLTITVTDDTPPNVDPVGNRTVSEETLVSFDGTNTTDNVGIANYTWDFGDGTNSTGAVVSHIYSEPGTYSVTLTVSDSAGNEAEDTGIITVIDGTPPTASASADVTVETEGFPIQFTAINSSDNVGITNYTWAFGDGTSAEGINATHIYAEAGVYNATLSVADTAGHSSTDKLSIRVREESVLIPNGGPNKTVEAGNEVVFSPRATRVEGISNVTYLWDFGDGNRSTAETPTKVYEEVGTHPVRLTVSGTVNATGEPVAGNDTLSVTVTDTTPPIADAGPNRTVNEDIEVVFDTANSSDNVGIVAYEWAFGDGTGATGPTPSHSYQNPGTYVVRLTVKDATGRSDTDTMQVTVTDTTPPTVVAGLDRTVNEDTPVAFDATRSSDNLGITNYSWSFGDGTTATGPTPTHTFADPGTYTVTLTVEDGTGLINSTTRTVTVSDVTAPTPDAGPNRTIDEGAMIRFDGTNSTDNAAIATYEWDFGDGTEATGPSPSQVYEDPGTYSVTLTVRDAAGNVASDTVTVTTRDVTPPEADAESTLRIDEDNAVDFDASDSTDNVRIASYAWEFEDGTTATGVTASQTYPDSGRFNVTLRVTDTSGNTGTDRVTIRVQENSTLVADAGSNRTVPEDTSLTLSADQSLSNEGITDLEWNLGDGSSATGGSVDHTYSDPGVYTVSLTVTDTEGNVDTDTITVSVTDQTPPVADAGPDRTIEEDTEVTFDGRNSSDNAGIASYTWSFGDQSSGTGITPQTVYADPGEYTLTLRVADAAGNTDTDTVNVSVQDVTPPTADTTSDFENDTIRIREQTTLQFSAESSHDNVDIANYTWTFTNVTPVNQSPSPNTSGSTLSGGSTFAGPGPDTANSVMKTVRGITASHTYLEDGTYGVTLNVTDVAGNIGIEEITVLVNETSIIIVDAGSDQIVDEDSTVQFSAAQSRSNEGIASYEWSFGDGTQTTGFAPTHIYEQPGSYTVTLTLTDQEGNTATDSITITVEDVTPPVAEAGGNRTVGTDTSLDFDATQSTDNVGIDSFEWTFGDGTAATGPTPSHAYSQPGTYPVTVTVTDAAGNVDRETVFVTVEQQDEAEDEPPSSTPTPSSSPPSTPTATPISTASHTATQTLTGTSTPEVGSTATTTATVPSPPTTASPTPTPAPEEAPEISVEPRRLTFADVAAGETKTLTLIVKNRVKSQQDLTVDQTLMVGKNPEVFTVVGGGAPFTLAPGETREIEIQFAPVTNGTREAQLQIMSDADRPQIDVWLSNTQSFIVVQAVAIDTSEENRTVNIDAQNIAQGSDLEINVSRPTLREGAASIDTISMSTNRAGDFKMNLTHSPDPTGADAASYSEPGRTAVQYVRLNYSIPVDDGGARGELPEDAIDSSQLFDNTSFVFRVQRSALPEGAAPEDVRFLRWSSGSWSDQGAEFVNSSGETLFYRVQTNGFSQFVVTAPSTGTAGQAGWFNADRFWVALLLIGIGLLLLYLLRRWQALAISVRNPENRKLVVTVTSRFSLAELEVSVRNRTESASGGQHYTLDQFVETEAEDGSYMYELTQTVDTDGAFRVKVERAVDTDGTDRAFVHTDQATVDSSGQL